MLNNISGPIAAVVALVWVVNSIFRSYWRTKKAERSFDDFISKVRKPTQDELLECVRKYGNHSNSFLTLYSGFQYFTSENREGFIAFLNFPHSWVVAAEPLAAVEDHLEFLAEFSKAAAQLGKAVILIPVGENFARAASSIGFDAILIGTEPYFHLDRYPPSGKTWINVVPTANQLDTKGARVEEVSWADISAALREEIDKITQEWLGSRKMDPLGFLNRVEPWTLSEHKRYFYLSFNGKILVFLVAIPTWTRKSWYFIDLIRRSEIPAGATELLTLQAMKILRNSGADAISLGVSPLAGLDLVNDYPFAQKSRHPLAYWFLQKIFNQGIFYNFNSLFRYKIKFQPTHLSPAFLIFKSPFEKLTRREVLNILQAFSQRGIVTAAFSGIWKIGANLSLSNFIKIQLRPSIVVRSAPQTWSKLLYRCRLTCVLILLQLGTFLLTTDSSGRILQEIYEKWGYSWAQLLQSPVHALLFSPFLHWNLVHLNFNLTCLFLFTGCLEYLAGTTIMAACYGIPMLLANPMTSLFTIPLGLVSPLSHDVGASLGIFGCAGALSWFFLRRRWIIVGPLLAATFLSSLYSQDGLILNHLPAIFLGIITGYIFIKT